MNRRECLRNSAVLLAGSAMPGCGQSGTDAAPTADGRTQANAQGVSVPDADYHAATTPLNTSGWVPPAPLAARYPALQTELEADVVVVGAGLAGASLSLHLAEAGVNVVVLEAREPGWGASGRNAGHVLPFLKDLGVFGRFRDGGKAFLELYKQHRSIPFDLARKYQIDCDAVDSGYLNAIQSRYFFRRFEEHALSLQRKQGLGFETLGSADMERMTGSRYYKSGILFTEGGSLNPYLLTIGLLAAGQRRGVLVCGGSEAVALRENGDRWRVDTAAGSVQADRVVFCTNAYPGKIVPEFTSNFYPLLAYAVSTKPLPEEALDLVMPHRVPMAQVPIDLNPMIVDGNNRIVTSSIPSVSRPRDANWHFVNHLEWIHRTWPETKGMGIEMEKYWTGAVALRDEEFPGVFELKPGVYGLMHFNAWGNLMAPLLGMLFADGLARDRPDLMPFPLERPVPVRNRGKQEFIIRKMLIPAARMGQRLGII